MLHLYVYVSARMSAHFTADRVGSSGSVGRSDRQANGGTDVDVIEFSFQIDSIDAVCELNLTRRYIGTWRH